MRDFIAKRAVYFYRDPFGTGRTCARTKPVHRRGDKSAEGTQMGGLSGERGSAGVVVWAVLTPLTSQLSVNRPVLGDIPPVPVMGPTRFAPDGEGIETLHQQPIRAIPPLTPNQTAG